MLVMHEGGREADADGLAAISGKDRSSKRAQRGGCQSGQEPTAARVTRE
jgi:hypothetical protein